MVTSKIASYVLATSKEIDMSSYASKHFIIICFAFVNNILVYFSMHFESKKKTTTKDKRVKII